jgi:hypothetical protein
MKDFLLRVVRNPKVRQAFVAFILAVLAALGISGATGCGGSLSQAESAVERAKSIAECQLAAIESVVPRYVAEDLVMAARAGNGEYVVKQLLALGLSPASIGAAADAFHACDAPPAAPAPDAGAELPPTERG